MEKKFGLIGLTLSHSFSKTYFDEKFYRDGLMDYHYDLYSLENIDGLKKLLKDDPKICGLNVTIPYKEQVLKFLSDIDPTAKRIGAVNVIKVQGGKLSGFNTDSDAFRETLEKWLPKSEAMKALVLGTGGSSKAVREALINLEIPFEVVSRKRAKGVNTYEDLKKNKEIIASCKLIVNTTPLGMSPDTDAMPSIDAEQITPKHFVYDLIYNPARTHLLQKAEMRGATIKNGLEMLHVQAEKAWAIWNN